MSDLPGLLEVAANNTVSEVRLQPESLAVLLYALDKIRNPLEWLDYRGEYISPSDIELIHELVDLAADDIMRQIVTTPVGATMTWHMAVAPDRWIVCEGGAVNVADYPELFALWGYKYGGSGAQFGIIDMRNVSPFGAEGGELDLDATAGAMTHTLTLPQIPAHTHSFDRRITNGAGATFAAFPGQGTAATDGLTDASGGGSAHNNLHPVRGVKWIVYGGMV